MSSTEQELSALAHRRKRVKYRASHRGTKELDLILGEFADLHVGQMDVARLDRFEQLMEEPETQLQMWLLGQEALPDTVFGILLREIMQSQLSRFTDNAAPEMQPQHPNANTSKSDKS